jgi:hypothetical protein
VSYETETKTHQVTFTQNCYETYTQTYYVVPSLKDWGYFETGLRAWACDPDTSKKTLLRILRSAAISRWTYHGVRMSIEVGLAFRKEPNLIDLYLYREHQPSWKTVQGMVFRSSGKTI